MNYLTVSCEVNTFKHMYSVYAAMLAQGVTPPCLIPLAKDTASGIISPDPTAPYPLSGRSSHASARLIVHTAPVISGGRVGGGWGWGIRLLYSQPVLSLKVWDGFPSKYHLIICLMEKSESLVSKIS